MEFQAFTHFKFCVEFQKIFPHLCNNSFYDVKIQSVGVHQSVQKIDVPEMLDKEHMFLRHISAQNLQVCELVIVVSEKFLDGWSIQIPTTTRAF